MNQSPEYFFLLDSHGRNCSGRVPSQAISQGLVVLRQLSGTYLIFMPKNPCIELYKFNMQLFSY